LIDETPIEVESSMIVLNGRRSPGPSHDRPGGRLVQLAFRISF
jgi:hypothetical protein